ncbi:MAG TPA: hypothetical protein VFN27_04545 [Xanthobacteraceae bacterium]|nr:hypothetical protein [Xanthobacteraceae bacterium]
MTSETDDKTGRRPPTIELAATEVDGSADKPATGEAEAGTTGAADTVSSNAPASSASGRRFASHIVGALVGAAVMAAAAAALWFTGIIPSRETAPAATAASDTSAPAAPSAPNPLPSPPPLPAAAQNSPPPDLTARLDKIERAIEAQRRDPALGSRIAELAAQTKALADNLAALTRRVDDIAATSQIAAKHADTALNAAETAKNASEATNKDQVRHEDVDALANRIMALESVVKGLAAATAPLASSGANDRSARLTIAAEALRAAVERGAPYQAELNAVQALGVDQKATAAIEPFATGGVPSAGTLARELEALVPALQEASEPRSGDTSFVERLKSNAQKLVRITPLNAPAGNDPQAVVDRIRLDAAHADIGAALADINALPDAAKPLAAAWSKKAAAREAALAASRQIAADALAALAQSSAR